jgi:hypothetical protein
LSALAVVAGLGLGLGLSVAAWQARLALGMYLAHLREVDKPAAPPVALDGALVERLTTIEGDLARLKVERLAGRR